MIIYRTAGRLPQHTNPIRFSAATNGARAFWRWTPDSTTPAPAHASGENETVIYTNGWPAGSAVEYSLTTSIEIPGAIAGAINPIGIRAGEYEPAQAQSSRLFFTGARQWYRGDRITFNLTTVNRAWVNRNWSTVLDIITGRPFFVALYRDGWPEYCGLVWVDGDLPVPIRTAPDWFSIAWTLRS